MNFLFPKSTSTHGSNFRRYWTLSSVWLCVLLFIESFSQLFSNFPDFVYLFVANILIFWSVSFFILVVATIPFLTSHAFWPNPQRLAFDALASITLSILVFSLIYRFYGLDGPDGIMPEKSSDFIYFSTVTFSTLGYGDFSPTPPARLYAAGQAIVGNLHLGMIVGVAFFAAQKSTK